MYGARFDNKNIKEYGAIMNYARITPPAVKENYIEIPGGDSSIDLTEAVGGITYCDGLMEFKFTLFDFCKKESMKNYLHGKRMNIILEREPEVYYEGRVSCNMDIWLGTWYELGFTARVRPYKWEIHETIHADSVNDDTKEVILVNTRKPVIPKIIVIGNINILYEGKRYIMQEGVYQSPELTLYEGINKLEISGQVSYKFICRKGRLI